VLASFGCRLAHALDPRTGLDGFSQQVWSTENGLPQSSVHVVVQTSDGFLWLGTEGGLARFNGYQFRVFDRENTPGFAGDDIRCLVEGRLGTLWVGTASGLTRLKDGRARMFTPADGVPGGAVRMMLEAGDGRLWVLTEGGLAASVANIDSTKVEFRIVSQSDRLSSGRVLSLAPDASGGIWIGASQGLTHAVDSGVESGPAGTVGRSIDALANGPGDASTLLLASPDGVMRLKAGVLSVLAKRETLPIGGVRKLLAARDGVWMVGRSSVSLIQPGRTVTFATGGALPGTQITAIAEDHRGAVWIGTNAGLARFWNGHMEMASGSGETGAAAVLAIQEDREGDLWVGTETAGVKVLRQRAFDIVRGPAALAEGAFTSVLQAADGALWAGTNGAGVARIGGGQRVPRSYTRKDGLASDTVLALGAGGAYPEDIWVGTPDGLSLLHEGRWRTFTSADGLGDDLVRSVLPAHDGGVWVGTRRGVTRWKDGHGTTLTSAQGLGSDLVGPMMEDSTGDLWIGTSGGLSRLHAGELRNYGIADGLPSNTITTLEASSNSAFWIGTNGQGLARWDGSKFFSFAALPGIPREIYGLLEDGFGSLWASSGHGIFRISIADLNSFRADRKNEVAVVPYSTADGLPPMETQGAGYPSAWRLDDGRLAFASRRGIVVVDPSRSLGSGVSPPVALEQVTVDDKSATPEEISSLAPGPLHFSFSFAGISLAAPQRVQYRYMLEGLDRTWIDAGTQRIAYYTNIPHGRYRFLVCARNQGEAWGQPAVLPFELRPHFFQTIWFRVLLAVFLGALGLGLYMLRVRTLQSRFDAVAAERSRLAREIHDTLAQSFVAVSVRLEVMSQMLRASGGVEGCREQLNQTRALVRESLAEARRSIWDLRSEGTDAQSLPARLGGLVRETVPRIADTRLEISGVYRALAQSLEDELYRIAQEAVANAVRHANAKTLRLRLSYELERVSLDVGDDGRGFDVAHAPSGEGGHFGLTGMQERARILGTEVILESVPGKGSSVRVVVPLTPEHKEKRKRV
jgi:ligand-binding sensor domain-containing protein/signal transduction histidine kinase